VSENGLDSLLREHFSDYFGVAYHGRDFGHGCGSGG
jgi:hypothetical protein